MKTIHVSMNEARGGAAIAAQRLHRGLVQIGVDSRMIVLRKASDDPRVDTVQVGRFQRFIRKQRAHLEIPSKQKYPQYDGSTWSVGRLSLPVDRYIGHHSFDIVHLHWIGAGYLSIKAIGEIQRPIVWTMHDMWAITGGCHYTGECTRYTQTCGKCPILGSTQEDDLSRWTWAQKHRYWTGENFTIVTPSHWLADCVRSSSLLGNTRIEVIPNGLDLNTFRPFDKSFARDVLKLPRDKKLILFGAYSLDDKRKGFDYLIESLRILQDTDKHDDMELVVFGQGQPLPDIGIAVHYVGSFQDDRLLALLYSAVDVFVAPSLQDNLPNTVMEAMACGTPTVAFKIGGMPDMITHQENGYLAKPFVSDDFAQGVAWILGDNTRYQILSQNARAYVEKHFDLSLIANQYRHLYEDILARKKGSYQT